MGIATAIGLGLGALGASQQASAARNATRAQTQASQAAIAEQRRQYDLTRSDQMPWITAGTNALGQMQRLNAGDYSSFYTSPDYQWTLDQGIQGLDRSAAARGRLYSGGYGTDLTQYAQGLASQQYGTYYNRLQSMAGQGQTTAGNLGTQGQNMANQIGNQLNAIGQARASGYQNQSNAWTNFGNQLGSLVQQYPWGGYSSGNNGVFVGASGDGGG